jgi:hypothetical protein
VATNGTPADVGGGYLDANAALASVVALPGAPRIVSNTNGNGRTTLRWSAAKASPKFPVTGYRVTPIRRGVPQAPRAFNTSTAGHVVSGLTNGASYAFTVVALNANGSGSTSAPSKAIVIGAPDSPSGVSATAAHQSATVHWAAPGNNGRPIVSYIVTSFIGSVAKAEHVFNSAATTQTIHGLTSGKTYSFKVAARNARGFGTSSVASKPVRVR